MNERHIRTRLKRRIGSRGAAMVEGVVVVSTMLVFLGVAMAIMAYVLVAGSTDE